MTKAKDNKNTIINQIVTGVSVALATTLINELITFTKSSQCSIVDVNEWDNSYKQVNQYLLKLDEKSYNKHKEPTTNKDYSDLTNNISYFIKLKNKNFIKVDTYKPEDKRSGYVEKHIRLSFIGKDRHKNRTQFIKDIAKVSDEKHILVNYMSKGLTLSHKVIAPNFSNIILDDRVTYSIINGLQNWNNSKDWYIKNNLVHKIGVFLHGNPGTGKSTVAKAISNMFNNAPIVAIDQNDVMNSIVKVIEMRRKHEGVIVVLIEDFDMYFKKREDIQTEELTKQNQENQNAIFQLLDGVYSSEDTIYIATTNHKDKLDPALIRYGRFDIREELDYFDERRALKCTTKLGYTKEVLDSFKLTYPVQPSQLQSKIMEYRALNINKGE